MNYLVFSIVAVFVFGTVLFLFCLNFSAVTEYAREVASNPASFSASLATKMSDAAPSSPRQKSDLTVMAVGDIMLDRGVKYMKEKHSNGGWQWVFKNIAPYLRGADVLFGNLEGPVSSRGYKAGSINSFRFEPAVVAALASAGFDILSLANNHTLDYTRTAFEDTMKILPENNIEYVGAGFSRDEAYQMKIMERRGVKIGFLAYTNLGPRAWQAETGRPGLAWINYAAIQNVKDYISAIRDGVDVLIVSLHGGTEYVSEPTSFQKRFARACIDAGADIVLGHHPHVVQPLERYKQGWIAYSLGNFVFDQGFSEQTMRSRLLEIRIRNKRVSAVLPHKIILNSFFQPLILDESDL